VILAQHLVRIALYSVVAIQIGLAARPVHRACIASHFALSTQVVRRLISCVFVATHVVRRSEICKRALRKHVYFLGETDEGSDLGQLDDDLAM